MTQTTKFVDKETLNEPIVVVGAGIVGLTAAYRLSNVTVVEKFNYGGQFCSHGNAGMIRGRS